MKISGTAVWQSLMQDKRFTDYHSPEVCQVLRPFVLALPELLARKGLLFSPVSASNILKAKFIFLEFCIANDLATEIACAEPKIKADYNEDDKAQVRRVVVELIQYIERGQNEVEVGPSQQTGVVALNQPEGLTQSMLPATLKQKMFLMLMEYRQICFDVESFLAREGLSEDDYILDQLLLDLQLEQAYLQGNLIICQLLLALPLIFIRHDPKP